jgi:ferrous iron transport protein A
MTPPPGAPVALTTLADGQHGVIAGVRTLDTGADSGTALRLGELGFLPGEPVRLLRRGPGGREPIAVQVGDTVFALRWVEAHGIDVIAEARGV